MVLRLKVVIFIFNFAAMTKEDLIVVSGTLEEIVSTWKEYRVFSIEYIEPKYIRLTLRSSSAGIFDEMLGIAVFDRISLRIGRILSTVFSSIPGLEAEVTYYHVGDALPYIPSADIYVFKEDVLNYCRRHH